ncbi:MAG: flagellar basal body protein [Acetobacteraceae bacterium]|nr:flagellar basal body protein [Acetobacteraceae bacterium]
MDTASSDVFAMAEKRLAWIGQRQSVLAQNVANANTPGYVARDVRPFADVLASTAQQTDSAGFTQETIGLASPQTVSTAGTSIDGNSVALDEQLEKIAETDTAHQLATNLYKKYVSLFKAAIGRN